MSGMLRGNFSTEILCESMGEESSSPSPLRSDSPCSSLRERSVGGAATPNLSVEDLQQSKSELPVTTRTLAHQDTPDTLIEQLSIRAVVRVRPFSHKDAQPFKRCIERPPADHPQHDTGIVIPKRYVSELDVKKVTDLMFTFDSVIWPQQENLLRPDNSADSYVSDGMQEAVFDIVGDTAVEHTLRGYNVCLLAYGQTGSGKSHTMFGPPADPGICPRAAVELFKELDSRSGSGVTNTVDVQIFEIYNEQVLDLLAKRMDSFNTNTRSHRRTTSFGSQEFSPGAGTNGGPVFIEEDGTPLMSTNTNSYYPEDDAAQMKPPAPVHRRTQSANSSSNYMTGARSPLPPLSAWEAQAEERETRNAKLRVRFHPDCGAFVDGARRDVVSSADELINVVNDAMLHRVTAATLMNDTSSRSHAIIQLTIKQDDHLYGKQTTSILNFVDLAGSERSSRSGVQGQQFTEAKNINQSLTTLRRVIDILIENSKRNKKSSNVGMKLPPYRETTLTFLLADSFGGNSRTTLLGTVSPHQSNVNDTVNTLRYAQKASKIVCSIHVNQTRSKVVAATIQHELARLHRVLDEEEVVHAVAVREVQSTIEKKTNVMKLIDKRTQKRREEVEGKLETEVFEVREKHAEVTSKLEVKLAAKKAEVVAAAEVKQLMELVEQEQRDLEECRAAVEESEKRCVEENAELDEVVEIDPEGNKVTLLQQYMRARKSLWRRAFIRSAAERKEEVERHELQESNRELRMKLAQLNTKNGTLKAEVDREGFDMAMVRRRNDRAEMVLKECGDDIRRNHMELRNKRADIAYVMGETDRLKKELEMCLVNIQRVEAGQDKDRVVLLNDFMRRSLDAAFSRSEQEMMGCTKEYATLLQQLAAVEAAETAHFDEAPELERSFVDLQNRNTALLADIRAANVDVEAAHSSLMDELIAVTAAEEALKSAEDELKEAERDLQKMERVMEEAEVVAREKLYPDAPPGVATTPLTTYTLKTIRSPQTVSRSVSSVKFSPTPTACSISAKASPSPSPNGGVVTRRPLKPGKHETTAIPMANLTV